MTVWALFRRHCPNASEHDERVFGATLRQFGEKVTLLALDRAVSWGSKEVTANRVRHFAPKVIEDLGIKREPREAVAKRESVRHSSRKGIPAAASQAQEHVIAWLIDAFGYKKRQAEQMVQGLEGTEEQMVREFLRRKAEEIAPLEVPDA